MTRGWLTGAVFAFLISPAIAATPLDLYVAGKYQAAIDAGVAQNSAAGLAMASRAALADAMMHETPCLECLQRAAGVGLDVSAIFKRVLAAAHAFDEVRNRSFAAANQFILS